MPSTGSDAHNRAGHRSTRVILTVAGLLATGTVATTSADASTHKVHVRHAATHAVARQAPSTASYTNWAGYQVRTPSPTGASASWIVPTMTWAGRNGFSNAWVGIGGGTRQQGQLIQAGTEHDSICVAATKGRCTKSRQTTRFWIETYPQRTMEVISNLPVSPGDGVSVDVGWSAHTSTASFRLCNWRLAQCVTASRKTSAPRGVAEFVVERPSGLNGKPYALGDFGSLRFSGTSVTQGTRTSTPSRLPTTRMTMFNGRTLASAGPLNATGDGFGVTYHRSN